MELTEQLHNGYEVVTPEDMHQLGISFAAILPAQDVILALEGDLGAGKTAFVKGLAEGLGIQDAVTSPTYNIYYSYEGIRQLVHMDAYRLESPDDINDLLLDDILEDGFCLVLEWPSKVDIGQIPYDVIWHLNFEITQQGSRRVSLSV